MTKQRDSRKWRAKAPTWLLPDSAPAAAHTSVDPRNGVVLSGDYDEEGRLILMKPQEKRTSLRPMACDRRHWTEIPPAGE